MIKKVAAYSEILYHLINFRTEQFQQLKKMVGIDYDSFMILSVMGAHYLKPVSYTHLTLPTIYSV